MKNSKKGISLIVLVITIIVIIILAAAVLLSIQDNNPIQNANTAVADSDLDAAQSAFNILMGKIMADCKGSATIVSTDNNLVGTSFTVDSKSVYKKNDGTFTTTALAPSEGAEFKITADDLGAKGNENIDKYGVHAKTGVIYKTVAEVPTAS